MPITRNTVSDGYKKLVGRIGGAMTESAVTKISIAGQSNAAAITPIDTSALINSQFREIVRTATGWSGSVGYTANYAFRVHQASGYLLGTSTPRDPEDPSRGNVWDPGAEPQFLKKGFERDGKEEIEAILAREYSV